MNQARYDAYKDSGIEWLGEVPAHWAVGKLKDIAFYQEGPGIMADDFQEEGVPLISACQKTPVFIKTASRNSTPSHTNF